MTRIRIFIAGLGLIDGLQIIDKFTANQFIKIHARERRHNAKAFEELYTANFERECAEEACSPEEFNECQLVDPATPQSFDYIVKQCQIFQPCNPKGSEYCANYRNRYECQCKPGFFGTNCFQDVDECLLKTDTCSEDETCVNTEGSYYCQPQASLASVCDAGYEPNSLNECVDINECLTNPCQEDSTCDNYAGGYYCKCNEGFALDSDSGLCIDANECLQKDNPCVDMPESCRNLIGSYTCECLPGYVFNSVGRVEMLEGTRVTIRECEDIDECLIPNFCAQICTNLPGSYKCSCQEGFVAEGRDCVEANVIEPICDKVSRLSNQTQLICQEQADGTFITHCQPGYEMFMRDDFEFECLDVNECEFMQFRPHSECYNTIGSFYFECWDGFRKVFNETTGENDCVKV